MANPTTDYRWQDHVPRLGTVDVAVTAAIAAVLLAMLAAPPGAPAKPDAVRMAAAAAADTWCGGRPAGSGDDV